MHFALHLGRQFEKDGMVLDTFPLERKHRSLKRFAELTDNFGSFEKTVLARAIQEQMCMPDVSSVRLLGACAPSAEIAKLLGASSAVVANGMHLGTHDISVNEVLICGASALQIQACVQAGGAMELIVAKYQFLRAKGAGKLWTREPGLSVFSPINEEFQQLSFWTFESANLLLTLV